MWRWVSTIPGITIMRAASMTSALGALMFGRTAEILPPSTSTSACSKSPTARSSVSTHPPLIRMARPGVVTAPGCCARAVPTIALATVEAAAALAAVVQRNWRRDTAGDGAHELQAQKAMVSSRILVVVIVDATPVARTPPARRLSANSPWVAAHRCGPRSRRVWGRIWLCVDQQSGANRCDAPRDGRTTHAVS